jgi:pimeloyl-ACP methyl ester carboxylesterase
MRRREQVLLVHGLWLNGSIMKLMQHRIAQHGYAVSCYSYPTLRLGLEENAERLTGYCEKLGAEKLHLVGHSMGGLVILNALRRRALPCLGRVVAVGTPYGGCFTARRLQRIPGGRWILGKCIPQWLSARHPGTLERYEIGVIAGCGGIGGGRIIAPDLPRPNDGVVCVSETAVPGMRDQIVLDVSHTSMLFSQEVARQVCAFLERGKFRRDASEAE